MLRYARNVRNARVVRRLVTAAVVFTALLAPADASAALGDCSQPATGGTKPAATDCLYILNVAVGLVTCTPECICAPKGSLPASATDALVCLQVAVNQPVTLDCPCDGTTTTTLPPGTTTTTASSASTTTTSTTSSITTSTTLLQCPALRAEPVDDGMEQAASSAENGAAIPCQCLTNEGQTCDGACPVENAACFPPGMPGELCECRGFGCGEDEGAPACNGLCPTGQTCKTSGPDCACEPVTDTPCSGATAPECDGTCDDDGSLCREIEGACTCVAVGCGSIAGPPFCLGVCPSGQACNDLGGGNCGCAAN